MECGVLRPCTKNVIVVAHNGRFDFRILALRFGIVPSVMADTMLMARYFGFPKCSLAILAKQLLHKDKLSFPAEGLRFEDLNQKIFDELCIITKTILS